MYQRSSLYWQLSQLSPVTTANDSAWPQAGPPVSALTARTAASPTCTESISCGRYEPLIRLKPLNSAPGPLNRSRYSTRAGD